jgi:hypothetical protein
MLKIATQPQCLLAGAHGTGDDFVQLADWTKRLSSSLDNCREGFLHVVVYEDRQTMLWIEPTLAPRQVRVDRGYTAT